MLFEAEEGDDAFDPLVWKKVSPMLGITIQEDWLAKTANEVKSKPAEMAEFKMKQLNMFVSALTAWIDRDHWDNSVSEKPTEKPQATFIAFDLASVRDMNAICTMHRYSPTKYYAKFQCFLPERSMDLIPKHYLPIYEQALQSGMLKLTEGNVKDDDAIIEYIRKEAKENSGTLKSIGYDPYSATHVVSTLASEGLPLVKVGQSLAYLSDASKKTEQLIMQRQILHSGDKFISWCFGNCEVFTDVNGNIKVRKNENDGAAKIDPIIAMIMSIYGSLDAPFISNSFGFRFINPDPKD